MRLLFDITTGALSLYSSDDAAKVPVSHLAPLNVFLTSGGAIRPLTTGEQIQVRLCQKGKYDSTPLASVVLTTSSANATVSGRYDGTLDTLNSDVETLLAINGSTTDDVASAQCRIDIGFMAAGGTYYSPAANSLDVDLTNNNFAEGADAPFPRPSGLFTPFACGGLTGGAVDNLDGIATLNLAAGTCIVLTVGGALQFWQLQASTAASNPTGGVVRPTDYAAGNHKVWIELL